MKLNELGKLSRLGLGFGSLCAVCGSIFGVTWLFNQMGSFRALEETVKTSWNDLNEVKSEWTTHGQKYEEIKKLNNLIFFKAAQLEETIEEFETDLSEKIKSAKSRSS